MEQPTNTFDIVFCLGPNDREIVQSSIQFAKQHVIGFRNVYVVSYDKSIQLEGATVIDENIFPFNMTTFKTIFGNNKRNGWYLQQLLKLYAGKVIPDILNQYLIIDSDTFFLKHTKFLSDDNTKIFCTTGSECYEPYFAHMNRLHPSLKKIHPASGICHHAFFVTTFVNELMEMVEAFHDNGKPFWQIFIDMLDRRGYDGSGCSEYELYFTFMYLYHPDKIIVRNLKWQNVSTLDKTNAGDNQFVSVHWYSRK